jgi:threonine dehydratase
MGVGHLAPTPIRLGRSASIDAIFVPVGGGGLIAGIASYAKALRPEILVIGVEPAGANAMAHSLAAGERVELASVNTFADGVAVKQVGRRRCGHLRPQTLSSCDHGPSVCSV